MRKRMLGATALALALGTGCFTDRNAAGVFVSEPVVEFGEFTQVGRKGEAWMFEAKAASGVYFYAPDRPVYVTSETGVYENGVEVELTQLEPGRMVRVVYELRRDGTGRAERIDLISPVTDETPPDADL
jgi:hypothetical protein